MVKNSLKRILAGDSSNGEHFIPGQSEHPELVQHGYLAP